MTHVISTVERQVRRTIARYEMLRPQDRVLVAVSGGPDSTALLALLHRLAPGMKLDLPVAHLDPGWRGPDSAREDEFVRMPCGHVTRRVTDEAHWPRGRQSGGDT